MLDWISVDVASTSVCLIGTAGWSPKTAARPDADSDRARRGGRYDPRARQIAINTAVSVNQQAAAPAHGLAHGLVRLDHQPEDPALDYATED